MKPPKGAAWRDWPTKAQAERLYSCTAQQLGALVRHGRIRRYKCDDKTIRFSPTELNEAFKVEPADDDDDDDRALERDNADPLLKAVEDSNRTLLELVKELREERRETLQLFFKDPMNQVLKALSGLVEMLTTDNTALRKGWNESQVAQQALISQQHERDMLEAMVADESKRAEERMQLLRTLGPQVVRNLGLNTETKTVVDLVQGLSAEQVQVIETIMTDAQKALFVKLRGASKDGAAAPQPQDAPS